MQSSTQKKMLLAFFLLTVAFKAADADGMVVCSGDEFNKVQHGSIKCSVQLSVLFINGQQTGSYQCQEILGQYRECSKITKKCYTDRGYHRRFVIDLMGFGSAFPGFFDQCLSSGVPELKSTPDHLSGEKCSINEEIKIGAEAKDCAKELAVATLRAKLSGITRTKTCEIVDKGIECYKVSTQCAEDADMDVWKSIAISSIDKTFRIMEPDATSDLDCPSYLELKGNPTF